MSFDAHKNFAYSTVATAPTPATSGTSLTVATGDGAKFPTAPFNATVWPAAVQPLSSNAEIVRVTSVVGDVLTITRAQESTTAVSIAVGYQIAATITKKTFDDIEAAIAGGGLTNIKLSAGTLSTLRSDITFANSNGVTFGLNTNGVITASAAGGGGSLNVSAGTTSNNLTNVVFSNGNNVSFGLNGSTVTASIANYITTAMASNRGSDFVQATAAFAGTNVAGTIASNGLSLSVAPVTAGSDTFGISNLGNTAGTSGVVSGDQVRVLLAGGNGITLSQSVNGASATITVSAGNYLTTAMASNRGSDFVQATAAFAGTNASGTIGSNGISVSVGPYITTARASNDGVGLNTAATNVTWTVGSNGLSLNAAGYAGTGTTFNGTNASATIGLNSAGLNFSLSVPAAGGGGTLTLFAGGNTTGQSSSSSFNASSLPFSGAGNVSVGYSGGSVIISGGTAAASPMNVSAGTTSNNLGSVVFSNSNGVSFGLNGSTVTATVSTYSTIGTATTVSPVGSANSVGTAARWAAEDHVHAGPVLSAFEPYPLVGTSLSSLGQSSLYFVPLVVDEYLAVSRLNLLMSMSSGTSATALAIQNNHTMNVALYQRNATNVTRLDSVFSTAYTSAFSVSSNVTAVVSFTGGNTGSAGPTVLSGFNGGRVVTGAFATTIAPGEYMLGIHLMSASTGSSVAMRVSNVVLTNVTNTTWGFVNQATASSVNPRLRGFGVFSAATAALPASLGVSDIYNGVAAVPYINLQNFATSQ